MRRKEMNSEDMAIFDHLAAGQEVGYLGLAVADGFPRVIPVNFVAIDRRIYFHGAGDGEKYKAIKQSPPVTFSIDRPLAVIPSYWLSGKNLGGATQLYQSVLIRGFAEIIEEIGEKCAALQKLMEKYQPEGNFLAVTPEETRNEKLIARTAVFKIKTHSITIKTKLPTGKPDEYKQKLIENLRSRGSVRDMETADEIARALKKPR